MASPTSESLFIDSNSSSDSLPKRSKRGNDAFEDLTLNNESDALSSTPSSTSSSEHPVKRRKLWAINIWKLRRKPTNKEPLVNSVGRQYWYYGRCVFWRNIVTTNIRSHLLNSYGITVKEKNSSLKQATKNRLKGLF
jgi:hypothetical protein